MYQRVLLFYNSYIKHYLFPQVEESNEGYQNHHKKKIQIAGQAIQNTALPLDIRVQGVHNIGLLAYTGSYGVAMCVAEYMPTIVDFLRSPDISDDQRIRVLESLTGMCYMHLSNQHQACILGLYHLLPELMDPASPLSTRAKLWSCYLLNTLCYNNVPAIRKLMSSQSLRGSLEVLEGEDWFGWPKNHAQELLCILGFWPAQMIKIPENKSS
ncbi:armadillo-like helical domain-containing protein 2 [Osmerus eperlanus]|uniref:armadillo-like helical domain-containing protein 2 n=1 Tax=Osmerus eperlanus TaxID=29151 RepID=UPI002E0E12A5